MQVDLRDMGSIPELGRCPGEGNGNALQDPCLDSPIDRGAWWAAVHGIARVRRRINTFAFNFSADQGGMGGAVGMGGGMASG